MAYGEVYDKISKVWMGFDAFKGSEGFIGRWDCFDHTLLEINKIYINEKEIWREKEITQYSETRYIYIW